MPGEAEQQQAQEVELDPLVVIDSLQAQLANKSMDLAKAHAMNAMYQKELADLRKIVDSVRGEIKDKTKVEHKRRITKSSKGSTNGKG